MTKLLQTFLLALVATGTGLFHGSAGASLSIPSPTHEYLDTQWNLTTEQYDVNYDSYYVYNADGHVMQRKLPNNIWVDHTLDGLGRDLRPAPAGAFNIYN